MILIIYITIFFCGIENIFIFIAPFPLSIIILNNKQQFSKKCFFNKITQRNLKRGATPPTANIDNDIIKCGIMNILPSLITQIQYTCTTHVHVVM